MSELFVHHHQVQFVETDMAGIVHFSNFFRYMEAAEDGLLQKIGVPLVGTIDGHHLSLPRLAAHASYKSPLRYPDRVAIEVRISELGEKKIRYRFTLRTERHLIAEGEILAICCTVGTSMRSFPFPDAMREKLEAYRQAVAEEDARAEPTE